MKTRDRRRDAQHKKALNTKLALEQHTCMQNKTALDTSTQCRHKTRWFGPRLVPSTWRISRRYINTDGQRSHGLGRCRGSHGFGAGAAPKGGVVRHRAHHCRSQYHAASHDRNSDQRRRLRAGRSATPTARRALDTRAVRSDREALHTPIARRAPTRLAVVGAGQTRRRLCATVLIRLARHTAPGTVHASCARLPTPERLIGGAWHASRAIAPLIGGASSAAAPRGSVPRASVAGLADGTRASCPALEAVCDGRRAFHALHQTLRHLWSRKAPTLIQQSWWQWLTHTNADLGWPAAFTDAVVSRRPFQAPPSVMKVARASLTQRCRRAVLAPRHGVTTFLAWRSAR